MNRARRENETREQYKSSMNSEQEARDRAISGTYIWHGVNLNANNGFANRFQGTAIRNPNGHLEGQPHYVKL